MCCVKGEQIKVQRVHCKADKCFDKWTPVESVCMCVNVSILRGHVSTCEKIPHGLNGLDRADVLQNKKGRKSKLWRNCLRSVSVPASIIM